MLDPTVSPGWGSRSRAWHLLSRAARDRARDNTGRGAVPGRHGVGQTRKRVCAYTTFTSALRQSNRERERERRKEDAGGGLNICFNS